MTDHDPLCPVMDIGCHSVGGYDKHHDRGRAGNCRCGQRCECALIAEVVKRERERIAEAIEAGAGEYDKDEWVAARAEFAAIARGDT